MINFAFLCLLFLACGPPLEPWRPKPALDGERPIRLYLTEKAKQVTALQGTPPGARLRMLEIALPIVSKRWNPGARGATQDVPVDWDDDPEGFCAQYNFSLWAQTIGICARWIHCTIEETNRAPDLYGLQGCEIHLMHELGHLLGADDPIGRGHVPQNGRPQHLAGPVMCGWSSDCQDPMLTDWTAEDEAVICNNGGHGGRCG